MTLTNGGTYAGKYPFHGLVDNLEPTLLIIIVCFLIQGHNQGHNLKKTINELPTRRDVSCFVLILEYIIYFPNSLFSRVCMNYSIVSLGDRHWQSTCDF